LAPFLDATRRGGGGDSHSRSDGRSPRPQCTAEVHDRSARPPADGRDVPRFARPKPRLIVATRAASAPYGNRERVSLPSFLAPPPRPGSALGASAPHTVSFARF